MTRVINSASDINRIVRTEQMLGYVVTAVTLNPRGVPRTGLSFCCDLDTPDRTEGIRHAMRRIEDGDYFEKNPSDLRTLVVDAILQGYRHVPHPLRHHVKRAAIKAL